MLSLSLSADTEQSHSTKGRSGAIYLAKWAGIGRYGMKKEMGRHPLSRMAYSFATCRCRVF